MLSNVSILLTPPDNLVDNGERRSGVMLRRIMSCDGEMAANLQKLKRLVR